jgi:hypothetical protein
MILIDGKPTWHSDYNRVARALHLSPDSKLVTLIVNALHRGVWW